MIRPIAALMALTICLVVAACGGDVGSDGSNQVTIEPLATSTIPSGGKPAAPAAVPTPTESPPAVYVEPTSAAEPSDAPPSTPEPPAPPAAPPTHTPVPVPTATPLPPRAPESGRWIDVDVTNYVVRLMDGATVVDEIAPVGVGVAIDTGDYVSTQTGLFYVHTKDERLVYDEPYDTYISHWIGFDADKDNGFHSFLKDAAGNVVDASTGRVSNGCIRTREPEAIFAFAEIGMPVFVHW